LAVWSGIAPWCCHEAATSCGTQPGMLAYRFSGVERQKTRVVSPLASRTDRRGPRDPDEHIPHVKCPFLQCQAASLSDMPSTDCKVLPVHKHHPAPKMGVNRFRDRNKTAACRHLGRQPLAHGLSAAYGRSQTPLLHSTRSHESRSRVVFRRAWTDARQSSTHPQQASGWW
jgi:hypothetical protein